jgi:hypothetical protein
MNKQSLLKTFLAQLFKGIFSLKNLRRKGEKTGQLQRVSVSPRPSKVCSNQFPALHIFTDSSIQAAYKVFRDPETGDISYYPKSLTLLVSHGIPSKFRY